MTHDDADLPDFNWSEAEVPPERHVRQKWIFGLASLALLVGVGVILPSIIGLTAGEGVTKNPWLILFGPFILLGELL